MIFSKIPEVFVLYRTVFGLIFFIELIEITLCVSVILRRKKDDPGGNWQTKGGVSLICIDLIIQTFSIIYNADYRTGNSSSRQFSTFNLNLHFMFIYTSWMLFLSLWIKHAKNPIVRATKHNDNLAARSKMSRNMFKKRMPEAQKESRSSSTSASGDSDELSKSQETSMATMESGVSTSSNTTANEIEVVTLNSTTSKSKAPPNLLPIKPVTRKDTLTIENSQKKKVFGCVSAEQMEDFIFNYMDYLMYALFGITLCAFILYAATATTPFRTITLILCAIFMIGSGIFLFILFHVYASIYLNGLADSKSERAKGIRFLIRLSCFSLAIFIIYAAILLISDSMDAVSIAIINAVIKSSVIAISFQLYIEAFAGKTLLYWLGKIKIKSTCCSWLN